MLLDRVLCKMSLTTMLRYSVSLRLLRRRTGGRY
jgi:hypothetical protein